jgi:hypothetical protein
MTATALDTQLQQGWIPPSASMNPQAVADTQQFHLASSYALSAGFGMRPTMYRKDSGALKMEGVAVFRSGTFRDSWGDQFTYENMHIRQMLDNFNYLKGSNIFPDVPVRLGHPGFMGQAPLQGQVIGYHSQLTMQRLKAPHEDEEYDYLLADYEILDPKAASEIELGLHRNRSAEIGRYRTNREAEFWPVYMGVAYVDIPAVEGLKFQSTSSAGRSPVRYFFMDKELSVTGQIPTNAPGLVTSVPGGTNGASGLPFAIGAQAYRVNGQATTDPNAVQSHIDVLEQFRTQVTDQIRNDFVNMLAAMQRISVHDVPNQQAFARSLNGEQFAAWRATFGLDVPPQGQGTVGQPTAPPALGPLGGGVSNPMNGAQAAYANGAFVGQLNTGTPGAPNAQPTAQLAVHLETVRQFKLAAIPKAQIEQSASYKALVAAGQTPQL